MNPIETELKILLNGLDAIGDTANEIGDTEVREQMTKAVDNGFINPLNNYVIPEKFGMFSDKTNKQVKKTLAKFLHEVQLKNSLPELDSPEKRLEAFQDEDLTSNAGMYYDDYFGYSECI